MHVFEFVADSIDNNNNSSNNNNNNHGDHDATKEAVVDEVEEPVTLVRRGSARANVPLSSFGRTHGELHQPLNATAVAHHLLAAFEYAATLVPERYHATTAVKYQATAGMRLLTVSEQDAVYDALYAGLHAADSFLFVSMQRSDIATLPGDLEGFYGAVAANYLKGTIDTDLQMLLPTNTAAAAAAASPPSSDSQHHHGPIGALDMGGSSTQIVFLPGTKHTVSGKGSLDSCPVPSESIAESDSDSDADVATCHTATLGELPSRLNGQDFFATSYLSYGVDQFRERLWTTWVQQRKELHESQECADSCDSMQIENPCTFKGYEIEWQGYTLIGTGDAQACVQQVQHLIPHAADSDQTSPGDRKLGSHVGGVPHPPVRGKFFAMSLYFFTLDSLRALSHPDKEAYEALNLSWPTPSIAELSNALDGLCGRSWEGDLEAIQHEAHAYTRPEVLPHRCLESVYMVTLLRDGFGFAPESRDITFTFLVDGSEVEWSLGMALVLRADEKSQAVDDAPSTDNSSTNATYEQTVASVSGWYKELTHQLFSAAS